MMMVSVVMVMLMLMVILMLMVMLMFAFMLSVNTDIKLCANNAAARTASRAYPDTVNTGTVNHAEKTIPVTVSLKQRAAEHISGNTHITFNI